MPQRARDSSRAPTRGAAEAARIRPAPTLICLGVNHRTADVETRERLQRGWGRLEEELRHLRACTASRWRLLEWVLLETCNRFELYAAVEGQRWAFAAWLYSRLEGAAPEDGPHAMEPERLGRALYRCVDLDAVRHLFEVASGLDSMVLGESEILGQVRRAARRAKEQDTLGEHLAGLFRAAVRAGRRVRHETEIGRHRSTVSSLALNRVEERLGEELRRARVLVVGLGEIGQLTLGGLRRLDVGGLGVVNRTAERARATADRHGLRWWSLDELDEALGWADVVFTCAASPEPLISRERLASVSDGGERPLLIVDLAVPRNVEAVPELQRAELQKVEVLALEDLGAEADEALRRRREALPQVHELLAEELEGYVRDGRLISIEPTIRELRTWSEALRSAELARLRRALGDVDEETWRAFEDFTRSLTDKLLHEPTTRLRESVAEGSGDEHLRALRRLFGLERRRRSDSASA